VKREKRLAVAVLLGVAAAWTWFVTHPGGDVLPQGSIKLASVSLWKEPSISARPASNPKIYFWTTNGDLLHLEQNPDSSTLIVRDHLTLFNTLQPDPAPPVMIAANSLFLRPTPDGSGLLYGQMEGQKPQSLQIHLRNADGNDDRRLSALWMTNVAWMPDGKHWIVSRIDGDYLNSLDGTPARKLDTSSLSAWAPFVLGVTPQAHAISTLGSDMFEPPTPFQGRNSLRYPTAILTEFDPLAPARNPKTLKVTMPRDSVRGQLMLSPQADRILWIVEKQGSGVSTWINRLQYGYYRPYFGDQALYVSQLNGTGMREIFSGPTQRSKRGQNVILIRPLADIRWFPDGKRISFVHQDALYIAPVD